MKRIGKRLLVLFICLCTVVTMAPAMTCAADQEGGETVTLKADGETSIQVKDRSGTTELKVSAGGNTSGLTYRWSCFDPLQGKDVIIQGANDASYTVQNSTLKWRCTQYECEMIAANGEESTDIEPVYFELYFSSSWYAEREGNYWVNADYGKTAELGVYIDKNQYLVTTDFSYQWYQISESASRLLKSETSSSLSSSYSVKNVTGTTQYICVVSSRGFYDYIEYGVTPKLADISVSGGLGTFINKASGDQVTLSVTAALKEGYAESDISYTWYEGSEVTDNSGEDEEAWHWISYSKLEDKTQSSMTITADGSAQYYRVGIGISAARGNITGLWEYDTVDFVVVPANGAFYKGYYSTSSEVTGGSAASCDDKGMDGWGKTDSTEEDSEGNAEGYEASYSQNISVTTDSALTLTVSEVTDGTDYKWTYYDPIKNTYVACAGATGSSYTVNSMPEWNYMSYCCEFAKDNKKYVKYFYIDCGADWWTKDENGQQRVASGSSVTLRAEIERDENIVESQFTYKWYKWSGESDGYKEIDGAASSSYTVSSVNDQEEYLCKVTRNGISDYQQFSVSPILVDISVDKTYYRVSKGTGGTVSVYLEPKDDDSNVYCSWSWGTVVTDGDGSRVIYEDEVEDSAGKTGVSFTNIQETKYLRANIWAQKYVGEEWVYDYKDVDFVIDPGTGFIEGTYSTDVTSRSANSGGSGSGSADNSADDKSNEKNESVTESKTETTTNASGKKVEITITTEKDEKGNVIGSKEVSVIEGVAKNTTATVTVTKSESGEVQSAVAAVTKTGTANGSKTRVTLSASVISQIQEAAGQTDVDVSMKVVDASGKTKFTVRTNAENLVAGNDLYAYILNTKTGEYTMVNSKTYEVSENGSVSITMSKKATYELLDTAAANKISKQILATVKPAKSSRTVKSGKKTSFTLSSKLNQDNVKSITYTTSKKSVATVSKSGKITSKKAGTVTVKATVTLKNGKTKTVSMKIKVK